MGNRYFTILIVPEKTSHIRRWIIPSWLFRGALVALALIAFLAVVMLIDYGYVMNQIGENKALRTENRKLKQQVQVFRDKMNILENTMDRIKAFATRLKVITNIEDRDGLLQSLNSGKLPDASTNIGTPVPAAATVDPEETELKKDYERLDEEFSELNQSALFLEQMLQDEYELLSDKKAFLAALPTRRPTIGYITSGFGIRRSPYGGNVKMHEGLDIANRPGTPIRAPADGVVTFAQSKPGYGQTLVVDHGYGLETWYGHTRKILVTQGQKVHRGDTIALLGNSGRSTGPHVHYEVRINGTPVDPLPYILEN